MIEDNVKIINRLGLHARAAAQLVKLAAKFQSNILIQRKDKAVSADAKSILSVLTLAASFGTVLTLQITGSDEQVASEAITALFESGFGEV